MTKKQEALVVAESQEVPAFLQKATEAAEVTGFENIDQSAMALSILKILQSNSPALQENEDLRAGMLYDSATGAAYKTLTVTMVGFSQCYVEYVPRESGGGFAGRHAINSGIAMQATKDGNKLYLPNGNELVETYEHMLIVWPEGGDPFLALLPLSSTQIKHSKTWNTDARRRGMVLYGIKYTLATTLEKNNKGSWYGLGKINFVGYTNEAEFELTKQAAEDYARSLSKASAAYSDSDPVVDVASEDLSDMA